VFIFHLVGFAVKQTTSKIKFYPAIWW